MSEHSLVWFRQDLRIQDNPALAAAASASLPVIALFIFAPEEEAPWSPGGASKWWLHHALASLAHELATLGVPLVIRRGKSLDVLRALADEFAVTSVFWNRRYEPAIIDRDTAIKQTLKQQGVYVHSFNGSLLFEPEQIRNQSGKPFRVFTPFWKHLRSLPVEMPIHVAEELLIPPASAPESVSLESLGLLPVIPWDKDFYRHWSPSRKGAETALQNFVFDRVGSYKSGRDLPGVEGTSRLPALGSARAARGVAGGTACRRCRRRGRLYVSQRDRLAGICLPPVVPFSRYPGAATEQGLQPFPLATRPALPRSLAIRFDRLPHR